MRPVLQAADLMLRLCQKDFLPFDFDQIENRLGANHALFKNLNPLRSAASMQPGLNQPAQKPVASSHQKNECHQGQNHLGEDRPVIAQRQIGYGKILYDRIAVGVRGVNGFADQMKKHVSQDSRQADSLIGWDDGEKIF